jgi:long-chain acyl-CoA synthetase
MEDLAAKGSGGDDATWRTLYEAVEPEDICTFIYTSGTTGPPKGCVISHGNYRSMLDMTAKATVLEPGQVAYLFLPLAHSFALLIQLGSFDICGVIAYWERDPLKIVPNLAEVRPHYFPSVPRIFEKIYTPRRAASRRGSSGGRSASAARSARSSAPAASPASCSPSSTSSPTSRCSRKSAACSAATSPSA